MINKIVTLAVGATLGACGQYAYRKYNPESTVKHTSREMIDSYISRNELEKGYLVNVLKAVSLMLKGFYHYSLITKLEGFNFHSSYLKRQEVKNK